MFAMIAGLIAILVVLGATITTRFDGGSIEKALVGLLSLPMLAFGNEGFSKGWLVGVTSVALIGLTIGAGGLPLLLSLLFLGVACAACWDDKGEVPEVVFVEEYLDEEELAIELAKAKVRIQELEAMLAQAHKPAATELAEANSELQEIFGLMPVHPADLPHPQWVREVANA